MKKIRKAISMLLFLAMAVASPSFASVGVKVGNTEKGAASAIKLAGNTGTSVGFDGSTLTFNLLLAGIANGGATSMTTSDTIVDVSYSFIKKAISGDTGLYQTGTLPDGTPGKMLTIYITERNGSGTWTLSPTTSTMFQSVLFDAVGESATFLWVDSTVGWVIWGDTDATVTLE